DLADLGELIAFAARLEERFELHRHVKMIFDRVLAAAGHQDDVGDAGRDRFLDTVLDDRLVDKRQHFLRLGLGSRQEARAEPEGAKRQKSSAGDEIGRAKRQGKDTTPIQEANRTRAQQIKQRGIQLDATDYQRNEALLTLPNLPHASVPVGKGAEDNVEVRRVGEPRAFDFEPKAHWDLGPALGIIDFERGTKIAGARFTVLSGAGARLSRALINFMLDLHTREHGYREIEPPFMANAATLTSTGHLPKFASDLFKIAGEWDLYLVPTAEVPLTG